MDLQTLFQTPTPTPPRRYFRLRIDKIAMIRVLVGDDCEYKDKQDLNTYSKFEIQVLPDINVRNGFPSLKAEYLYSTCLSEQYYIRVPREDFEEFIRILMRMGRICPGPWMTEEERQQGK